MAKNFKSSQDEERNSPNMISARKLDHIDLCLKQDVQSSTRFTGFSRLNFIPTSLPELDFSDLDMSCSFLNRSFSAPILITGMTGGIEKASLINSNLAKLASHKNIPMGVGSQRIAMENSKYSDLFRLKDKYPDLFLIGNIGISQILEEPGRYAKGLVDMIAADALAIHVNCLQELVQEGGDRNFKGVMTAIEKVCKSIECPVILKEVGSGMSIDTYELLSGSGISAIDLGGKGGTSWGYIEGLRSDEKNLEFAKSFRDWGIPTAYSLARFKSSSCSLPLIATGGIRDGLTVAKAVAMGAQMVGIGLPFLKAAIDSEQSLFDSFDFFTRGLKTTMLLTASKRIEDLSDKLVLGQPYESEFDNYFEK